MTQESRNIPKIAACSRPELLLDALERGRTELCQVEEVVGHGELVVTLLARRRGRRALRLQADDPRGDQRGDCRARLLASRMVDLPRAWSDRSTLPLTDVARKV